MSLCVRSREELTRLIPCVLLLNGAAVKTRKFKMPEYVGDPINIVKIFSDKCADELIVLDIGATVAAADPNYSLLEALCSQASMPMCYGGGIRSLKQAERLHQLGFERISVSAYALERPEFVKEYARCFGSQSIVITLDIEWSTLLRKYIITSHNRKRKWDLSICDALQRFQDLGAGELVISNTALDGTEAGYDQKLIQMCSNNSLLPIVPLGGASSVKDMQNAIQVSGASGAAAGSIFIYRKPHRAVLPNYPTHEFE